MRLAAILLLVLGSLLSLSAQALGAGSFGGAGSGDGQFNEPTGVAVNETSGDVYVADKGNNRVEIFSPEGAYLSQFDGSETPAGSFSSPEAIAVDNSCVGGALECADESVLDVYVADTGHHVIDKFSPDGKYLGQMTGTGPLNSFSGKLGVAVDPKGDVWVNEEDGTVDEFNNAESNLFLGKRSMGFSLNPGIAVDAEGHVYVIDAEHDVNFEKEEQPIGHRTPPAPPCHCDTGLALDAATNDVYVDEGTSAGEYNSKGDRVGTTFGSGQLSDGTAIAFNAGHGPVFQTSGVGDAYVTDTSADLVWIFTPHQASVESCGGVQPLSGGVTLCAVVNPNGESIEGCHFEFGEGSGYGDSFPCSPSPPYSGEQPTQIEASVTGLRPNTTYHYRVALISKNGTIAGPDQQFSTPPSGPAPEIESLTASGVTQNNATLEAQINPEGQETEYELWIEDPCPPPMECIRDVPLKTGEITAGSGSQSIKVELASSGAHLNIEPEMRYSYWVIAKSAGGTVEETKSFKTLPISPVIESESVSGLSEHDATLQAKINPEGLPHGVYYQFQLVKNTSEYLPEIACPEPSVQPNGNDGCGIPGPGGGQPTPGALPIGFIPAGSEGQSVSEDLATAGVTLQPGVTYHYRVLVARKILTEDTLEWQGPPVIGADQTFTTNSSHARPLGGEGEPPPAGPPSASGTGPSTGPGSSQPSTHPTTPKPKPLTRSQKLKRALKLCSKKPRHKRAACKKQARKRYGPVKKKRIKGK